MGRERRIKESHSRKGRDPSRPPQQSAELETEEDAREGGIKEGYRRALDDLLRFMTRRKSSSKHLPSSETPDSDDED